MAAVIFFIFSKVQIPRFIKAAIGAVVGYAIFEPLRSLLANGVISLFDHDASFKGIAAILAYPGYRNIPSFAFFGFLIGQAAVRTKGYICPNCKKPFEMQFEDRVGGIQATGLDIDTFEEPCPHCGAILVYASSTSKIISHKPKKDSED
jgi:DNA-directed RNA polymerase subunit RPC12/RpoP